MALDVDGRWQASIGDPSPIGWITVAAYAVAALMAARNAAAARRTAVPTSFWIALTAVMVALGINKQLDLQSWFGEVGRDMARAEGWYEQRRVVQGAFMVALAVGAVGVVAGARRYWAALWHEYRWVFIGITLLLMFIVIRAASFHHIDELIGIDVGATSLGRAFEIVGVLAIAVACAQWHRMHRRRVRRFAIERALRR
jgi:hypothetical protein